jgi:hypothetical protein
MKTTHFVLTVSMITLLLCVSHAAARERGKPGSEERKAYCFGQYIDCVSNGTKACDKNFPDDPIKARACYSGSESACSAHFHGLTSPCMTQTRISPFRGLTGLPPTTLEPKREPTIKKPERAPSL